MQTKTRLIALLLGLVLIFCLSACQKAPAETADAPAQTADFGIFPVRQPCVPALQNPSGPPQHVRTADTAAGAHRTPYRNIHRFSIPYMGLRLSCSAFPCSGALRLFRLRRQYITDCYRFQVDGPRYCIAFFMKMT